MYCPLTIEYPLPNEAPKLKKVTFPVITFPDAEVTVAVIGSGVNCDTLALEVLSVIVVG